MASSDVIALGCTVGVAEVDAEPDGLAGVAGVVVGNVDGLVEPEGLLPPVELPHPVSARASPANAPITLISRTNADYPTATPASNQPVRWFICNAVSKTCGWVYLAVTRQVRDDGV